MFPSAAVVALWIVTALAALVVVSAPNMLIAPPPPFTRIAPAPELRIDPAACDTPPLLDVIWMFPPRVVMLPAAPNDTAPPVPAFRLTAREFAPVAEIESLTVTEPAPPPVPALSVRVLAPPAVFVIGALTVILPACVPSKRLVVVTVTFVPPFNTALS